ncbi:hypothetical protein BOX15_Mlig002042g3 [Macrostomum lignano]|uniref:receptor protein-tyrosine kinase n=1 Tax=Macrostomum lignano TaxID=282301 RepID=A0A267GG53_9PLAT|nr:hypothetical protein BOX15_Mlig002042g3 [Macrostomum lignano]
MLMHLMALCLLLPLSAAIDTAAVNASSEYVVCTGTLEAEQTNEDSVRKFKALRDRLSGCQFVIGDIHLTRIKQEHFDEQDEVLDFGFLNTIKEVTGCVKLVDSCFSSPLEFESLQVIRGTGCGNSSLLLQFDSNCALQTPYVAFPNLRHIGGGIILYNVSSCYIERHVSFSELFAYPMAPVVSRIGQCRDLDNACHSNCTEWPEDGQQHCWGPELRHCQPRTRCRHLSTRDCPYQRCFVDSQGGERCCHEQCLGGCFGPLAQHCLGCRNFDRNGTCVQKCELENYYHPGAAQNLSPVEGKMLPHGPVCVTKCPGSYFTEDGSCVKKCMSERKPDADGVCVAVDESRVCEIEVGALSTICHSGNPLMQGLTNASMLCTEFHGSVTVNPDCFSDEPKPGKVTVEQLYTMFSRLRVVRGEIQLLLFGYNQLRNLTFLSHLERVDDRPGEKKSGRIMIVAPEIHFFGLASLRFINKYIMFLALPNGSSVSLCTGFIPKQDAVNESLIQLGASTTSNWLRSPEGLDNIRVRSICPIKPDSCDPQCEPRFGCWGPGPTNCVRCRSVKAGRICLQSCESSPGWFLVNSTKLLEKQGNTTLELMCSRCHHSCAKCDGPGPSNCTACLNGTFLDGSVCVAKCNPETQFEDVSARACQPCPKICTSLGNGKPTCTGNKTLVGPGGCQFCQHVVVTQQSEADFTPLLKCGPSSCPAGFYTALVDFGSNQFNNFSDFLAVKRTVDLPVTMCAKCAPHCMTCKGASNKCTACRHYSIEPVLTDEFECETRAEPACRDGFYADHGNQTCRPCAPPCSTCSGPGEGDCLRCVAPKYLVLAESEDGPVDVENSTSFCTDTCPEDRPRLIASKRGLICTAALSTSMIGVLIGAAGFAVSLAALLSFCCIWRRRRSVMLPEEEKEELEPMLNRGYLATISENELARGPEVGSGAFGTVFKGEWTPADGDGRKTTVAIKILADSGDNGLSSELLEESRIMASVDHPHCVRLVGICMTQPLQLVTQFMPLGNLRDFLRARREPGQIGAAQMLRYAAQIASGMAHLERCNIIHRDLACRNVLVSSSRCVRITDFGLAKALDTASQEYQASGGKLPVKWLALESLISRRFTHKSDVWSYGITLWEIFTFGEPPYPNVKPQDLAEYLEKGERLPQPAVCMLDVYMLMIKCWMLDEHHRPTFDELEANFTKMCSQPERYVYNRGVRHPSHCSSSRVSGNSRGGSGGGGPKSPRHSNNNRQSLDELDDAYVAMEDEVAESDLDNDVFVVDQSTLNTSTTSTACRRLPLSPQPLLYPSVHQNQHRQLLPSAPPPPEQQLSQPPPPPPPLMKPPQRSFSVTSGGRRRAAGPPPPLVSSSPQNQYTMDPCQPGPSNSDYYLQPVCLSAGSRRENPLPLPPRLSPVATHPLATTPTRPPLPPPLPPPLLPPLLQSAGSPGAVANPEYFFHYSGASTATAAADAPSGGAANAATAAATPNPASSNDSGIASPKFEFGHD